MKHTLFWIMITGMVISSQVFAQDQPQWQKNILQFVGMWKSTDIELKMGDLTYGGIYTFDCSAVNMNTGILAHEKFENEEMGTRLAENLLGYDPNLQLVHLYTIDNFGTAHDHFGNWIDDNHLFLQYQGVLEGQVYLEQLDIVFRDANTMVLNMTGMLDGEISQQASGTFRK